MALKKVWIGSRGPYAYDDGHKYDEDEEAIVGLRVEDAVMCGADPSMNLDPTGTSIGLRYLQTTKNINKRMFAVEVADITDPVELNDRSGDIIGSLIMVYEASGLEDTFTLYGWDEFVYGGGEDPPYLVDGADSGFWVAIGGMYNANPHTFRQIVTCLSGLAITGSITVTGTVDGVDIADHSARHENDGDDEISVDNLSGLLADSQIPLAHDFDSALHTVAVGDRGNYIKVADGASVLEWITPANLLTDIDAVADTETFTEHKHVPASQLGKNKTNPPTVEQYGITEVLEFVINTDKADYTFHVPTDYASGNILLHVHWTRNKDDLGGDSSSETVKWQGKNLAINGTSENCNSGEATDAIQDVYDSATLNDNIVYHTAAMTITAAEIAIEDLVICEIMAVTVDSGTPLAKPALVCLDMEYTAYKIRR